MRPSGRQASQAREGAHYEPQDGPEVGSQYVFVAMEANTKLVLSHIVGKRDKETALALMQDLGNKVSGRFHLTTDSFPGFRLAVEQVFGWNGIDYGQITKNYTGGETPVREGYGPTKFIRTRKVAVYGNPDLNKISTSYSERQNLTMRMQMRCLTRLTNGFSKNLESLKAALALHFCWYNFGRVHQTLRVTPAMEAGITIHIWLMQEIVS